MSSLIITCIASVVVFGLPSVVLVFHAKAQRRQGQPSFTYGVGLLWFLGVGLLGFIHVSMAGAISFSAQLDAEIVGLIYIYAFLLYLGYGGVILFALGCERLGRLFETGHERDQIRP